MTIKDIIEKLEDMKNVEEENLKNWHNPYDKKYINGQLNVAIHLLLWIKSNLEEGYEKYGNDRDDWKESKIAEEREG